MGISTRAVLGIAAIAVALASFAPAAHAQRYLVHSYSEASGLPSSNVFSVHQAASGRMWFVTRNGVARYDGLEWQAHEWGRGVPRTSEDFYAWDERANLWVAPELVTGWFHRFDEQGWHRTPGPRAVAAGLRITAFEVGSRGPDALLAFGVRDGRVFLSTPGGWFTTRTGQGAATALAFVGGRLLVGTPDGLLAVNLDAPYRLIKASARGFSARKRSRCTGVIPSPRPTSDSGSV